MISRKKKPCKACGEEGFIWARGMCKACASKGYKKLGGSKPLNPAPRTDRQKLIRELDTIFSINRRKQFADKEGNCKCFTCDRVDSWNGGVIALGHFITRSNMCVRWHPMNGHPQCFECNVIKQGNIEVYRENLFREYGIEKFNEFINSSKEVCNYTILDLEEIKKKL